MKQNMIGTDCMETNRTEADDTKEEFIREVLHSEVPVLVEFFALWCSKCAMMKDIVDELEQESRGKYRVCRINVDRSPVLAAEYRAEVVPTFLIIKNGETVAAASGVLDKKILEEMLEI